MPLKWIVKHLYGEIDVLLFQLGFYVSMKKGGKELRSRVRFENGRKVGFPFPNTHQNNPENSTKAGFPFHYMLRTNIILRIQSKHAP